MLSPSLLLSQYINRDLKFPGYPPTDIYYTNKDVKSHGGDELWDSASPDIIIEMAVAGFKKEEITVSMQDGELIVAGQHTNPKDVVMLHHGISRKSFSRRFNLSHKSKVKSCSMDNGILTIVIEPDKSPAIHHIPIK